MNRGFFVELIVDAQAHVLPFAQADKRPRHGAVQADGVAAAPFDVQVHARNSERDVFAAQRRQRRSQPVRVGLRPRRQRTRGHEPGSKRPCAMQ